MFNQTRYGTYNQKTYNNDTPGTLKLLAFVAVVCIFGGSMWALFQATNSWTNAVGATWNADNNNTMVHEIGGAIGSAIVLVAGVVSGLTTMAMLPWFIRNMRVALNTPVPGQTQRYNVIDAAQDDTIGLIEQDAPAHGLLMDSSHHEHYIDATHQLADNPQLAHGFNTQNDDET